MIDWKKYGLINYWHSVDNIIILKLLNNKTYKIEYYDIVYPPYFYIKKEDIEKCKNKLSNFFIADNAEESMNINFEFKEEKEFCKVIYSDIPKIWLKTLIDEITDKLNESDICHYELDLWPADNYVLNNDVTIAEKYRILYFDIETRDDTNGIMIGRDRILSICGVDNEGNKFEFCDEDEEKILKDFVEILDDYDIMTGWNSQRFDIPYLKARCLLHKIRTPIHKNIIPIDLMKVFQSNFAFSHFAGKRYLPSFALDYISKEFLKDEKLKIDEAPGGGGGKIWNLFQNDRKKLLAYNMQDCVLLKKLDDHFDLIKNEVEVAKLAKAPLSKTQNINSTMDFVILREARKQNLHFKSRPQDAQRAYYEGAYVHTPIPGYYKNICIFDFASLYPNLCRTFNVSPETILAEEEPGCIKTPNNTFFCRKRGIVPSILDKLVNLRYKYKDEQAKLEKEGKKEEAYKKQFQQSSAKQLILYMYGILGSSYSRFFNKDVAESITVSGQYFLKCVIKHLDLHKYNAIYGDTDSIFARVDDTNDLDKVKKLIQECIDVEVLKFTGDKEHTLEMKLEKIMDKFIILAKKKYIGKVTWDVKEVDELYYRGIELAKGSEILLTKKLLNDVVKAIFWNDATKEEIIKIILDMKKYVYAKNLKSVDEITIVKKIGHNPNEYKNKPLHVSLAEKRMQKGDTYFVNKRIPHIVVSTRPLKIIHQDEFKDHYDEQYYWKFQIGPPTIRLLSVVFPNHNWESFLDFGLAVQTSLFK